MFEDWRVVLAGGDGLWSHLCCSSFTISVNYVTLPHLYLMSDCSGVILHPVSERHPSLNPCFCCRDAAVAPEPASLQQHIAVVMLLQFWMIHMRR